MSPPTGRSWLADTNGKRPKSQKQREFAVHAHRGINFMAGSLLAIRFGKLLSEFFEIPRDAGRDAKAATCE